MNKDIAAIRQEYTLKSLDEREVSKDPIKQFNNWLTEALDSLLHEPTAMHIATVDANGRPSGRIVLLKGVENNGLVFYTNYDSRKGKELIKHPQACITFFWPELERQIRIEGVVEKVSPEMSDEYFNSRPVSSRLGAIASPQSKKIKSRDTLEAEFSKVIDSFKDREIVRPENWGGFILNPDYFEFWQGRSSRLHDRIVYEQNENSKDWTIGRLAP
ncbi:pyridoxamine 5'-phosphate oxidase [Peijinzhouia sedimentorum]